MSKEYNNKDLGKPEVQAEIEQTARARNEARTHEIIGQHLTRDVVANIRLSAQIKVSAGMKPSQLVGVLTVNPRGQASWGVEQRFGFPYGEIPDRDVRRIIWEGLEKVDEEDQLRILIIDQQHNFGASIRIPIANRGEA